VNRIGRLAWIAASIPTLVLPACTGNLATPEPSDRITQPTNNAVLQAGLVTARDLVDSPQAPAAGFQEESVSKADITQDPDPRAPCGKKMYQPSLRSGVLEVFSSDGGTVFQWLNRLPKGVAQTFASTVRGDIRPGCPSFQSATPGGTQLNEFLHEIPLQKLRSDAVATESRVTARGAQSAYAAQITMDRGPYLTFLVYFSQSPIADAFIQGVAQRIDARFSRLPT